MFAKKKSCGKHINNLTVVKHFYLAERSCYSLTKTIMQQAEQKINNQTIHAEVTAQSCCKNIVGVCS